MALTVNPRAIQIREPNLLIPGRKPVGSVKIDWSHRLIKPPVNSESLAYGPGLRTAILFSPGFKDLVPWSPVNDGYTLVSPDGGSEAEFTTGPGGELIDCNASGQCVYLNTPWTMTGYDDSTDSITISTLIEFPLLNGSINGIIGDTVFRIDNVDNTVDFHGTSYPVSTTIDFSALTGPHRVVLVAWKNTTEGTRVFVDGVFVGSNTSNNYAVDLTINGFGNANVSLNRDRGTALYDLFIWEGYAMSDDAVSAHCRDPYQILIVA